MAANDLLTLPEAKRALRINDSSTDSDLAEVVTEASMHIDTLCGPVVRRDVTETILHPAGDVFLDVPPGSPTFTVTFTSVTEYSSGVPTMLTAEDFDTSGTYRWDPTLGRILRRSAWAGTVWGPQEVVVAYEAGRFDTTEEVDQRFKGACRMVVAHIWQARGRTIAVGAPVGGEGPPGFAGIPYSPEQLDKWLRFKLREELLMSGHGLTVA